MIYTVTFSPSIDYSVFLDNLEKGKINRSKREIVKPGGKGINVSIVLSKLGVSSVATGFIAGFTGEYLKHELNTNGIVTDFIEVPGALTRINVKVNEKEETAINGNGFRIEKKYISELIDKIDDIDSDDIVVVSGSIPRFEDKNSFDSFLNELENRKLKYVLDISGKKLIDSLKYHPFLVKPNKEELEEALDIKITNNEDLLTASYRLIELGASNVIVSLGKNGAFMIGKDLKPIYVKPYQGKFIDSVGAGDSLVAGFLYEYLNSSDMVKALKCGVNVGAATAYSEGLASNEELERALRM